MVKYHDVLKKVAPLREKANQLK